SSWSPCDFGGTSPANGVMAVAASLRRSRERAPPSPGGGIPPPSSPPPSPSGGGEAEGGRGGGQTSGWPAISRQNLTCQPPRLGLGPGDTLSDLKQSSWVSGSLTLYFCPDLTSERPPHPKSPRLLAQADRLP